MEALGEALHRLHGTWAERLATGEKPDPCADAAVASVAARSHLFGAAYRDAVQNAHAQMNRVEGLVSAPTVRPLLDAADLDQARLAHTLVERHRRMVVEDMAWHATHIEPKTRACPPTLVPTPGIAYAAPLAGGGNAPVALYVRESGRICPANEPVSEGIQFLTGPACFGVSACTCAAEPLEPGAVWGTAAATGT
jgi:hypothetical protein